MSENTQQLLRTKIGPSLLAVTVLLYVAWALWYTVPAVRACKDDESPLAALAAIDASNQPLCRYTYTFGSAFNARFLMHLATRGDAADSANYWEYFTGALAWLDSTKVRWATNPERYIWRRYHGQNGDPLGKRYEPRNVAAIGDIFLEAFNRTEESSYWDVAEGVAEWLMDPDVRLNHAATGVSGYAWPLTWEHPDVWVDSLIRYGWSYGITGIGEFFFNMWKADTGDAWYENYARGTARHLMDSTVCDTGTTRNQFWVAWPGANDSLRNPPYAVDTLHNTTWCVGNTGIVGFFDSLDAYFGDEDSRYSKYADGGRQWILNNSQYKYYVEPPLETLCYWYTHPAWCCSLYSATWGKGAAGTGQMFLKSADLPDAPGTYLDHARYAANWIKYSGRDGNPGKKWPRFFTDCTYPNWCYQCARSAADTNLYLSRHCMGNVDIASFLVAMHDVVPNEGYGAMAESSRIWLESLMVEDPSSGTYTIQWGEHSVYARTGLTGVGAFGEKMYQAWCVNTADSSWLALADTAAQWLAAEAKWDSVFGGYRWPERNWPAPLHIVSFTNESDTARFSAGDTVEYTVVGTVLSPGLTDSVRAWVEIFGQNDSFHPRDKVRTVKPGVGQHTYPLKFVLQDGYLDQGEASFTFSVAYGDSGDAVKFVIDQASFPITYE